MKNILLIPGTLRKDSFNVSLLKAFETALTGNAEVTWADTNLPLYNQDLEGEYPQEAQTLKEQITAADAVIIASPEYNRGYTPVIKNAVDWASRPYGENSWAGTQVLLTSATLGTAGGALGSYQLSQVLTHLKANVLPTEFFVASAQEKFTDGVLTDDSTKDHITSAVEQLLA